MQTRQRIFKCTDVQILFFFLTKSGNILTITCLSLTKHRKLSTLKNSRSFSTLYTYISCTYTRLTHLCLGLPRRAISQYKKSKTNLDFTEAREWVKWHKLGHMQVCTSLQTENHASSHCSIYIGRMPFLLPNQQCQSTVLQPNLHLVGYRHYKEVSRKT